MGRGGPQLGLKPFGTKYDHHHDALLSQASEGPGPLSPSLRYLSLDASHLNMTSPGDDYDDKLADSEREARNKEIRAREQQEQAGMHP